MEFCGRPAHSPFEAKGMPTLPHDACAEVEATRQLFFWLVEVDPWWTGVSPIGLLWLSWWTSLVSFAPMLGGHRQSNIFLASRARPNDF